MPYTKQVPAFYFDRGVDWSGLIAVMRSQRVLYNLLQINPARLTNAPFVTLSQNKTIPFFGKQSGRLPTQSTLARLYHLCTLFNSKHRSVSFAFKSLNYPMIDRLNSRLGHVRRTIAVVLETLTCYYANDESMTLWSSSFESTCDFIVGPTGARFISHVPGQLKLHYKTCVREESPTKTNTATPTVVVSVDIFRTKCKVQNVHFKNIHY